MQACPMAHDFDFRYLRLVRAFETLQLLSWNRNLQPVGKIEAHQILSRFMPGSNYTRIMGLELARARDGGIDLAAGDADFVWSFTHAFSPTAKLAAHSFADNL